MKLRVVLALVAAVLLSVSFSQAQNCNATIIDRAGVIRDTSTIANAARSLINQGADVRIITVDSVSKYSMYGSGLAGVESYFEQACPSWRNSSGQRKENLFVVMVAPFDRAKNLFLGSNYNGAFDIPSTYSRLANPYFSQHQWEMGIAATLNGTTNSALAFRQRAFAAQRQPQRVYTQAPAPVYRSASTTQSSGASGLEIFLIVLVILTAICLVLYFIFRNTDTVTTTTYGDSTYYPPSPTSSYTGGGYSGGYATPRSYAAAAPSTVVINNQPTNDGFVTGMMVGEMMSRPNPVIIETPAAPVYENPAPVYEQPTQVVQDAPDSTWEDNASQPEPDTDFSVPDSPSGDTDSSF